jgi:hypothetical protein
MATLKFPNDPRMQRLHEACEERAAAQAAKGIDRRDRIDPSAPHLKTITSTELRMMTGGPPSATQVRLVEMMAQYQPNAEDYALIDETERKMLGLPAPIDLTESKLLPNGEEPQPTTPAPDAVRSFIVRHGRAPTREELRQLVRTPCRK